MLATLLAFYLQSVLSSPLNFQQPLRFNDPLASKVSFLVLGDWGSGFKEQKTIAGIMHTVAELNQSEFIVAVGDNFYTQGVVDTNDSKFADYWKNMYTGYLANIPWYVVLGNHDWYGNPVAQIEYTKIDEKWVMVFIINFSRIIFTLKVQQ
jgi:predicted MPP superfamily phosphohydrolase